MLRSGKDASDDAVVQQESELAQPAGYAHKCLSEATDQIVGDQQERSALGCDLADVESVSFENRPKSEVSGAPEVIRRFVGGIEKRCGDDQPSARAKRSGDLGYGGLGVVDVLEHARTEHRIEGSIAEGERCRVGKHVEPWRRGGINGDDTFGKRLIPRSKRLVAGSEIEQIAFDRAGVVGQPAAHHRHRKQRQGAGLVWVWHASDDELRIVGDGPLRPQLENEAAGLPVVFLGSLGRRELAAEYGAASVAVFPSVAAASGDQDGLPVALLEAMSAGCAIVASRLPGIADAIVPGESGLLVEPGSASQIADALRSLLSDEGLRLRLGAGASARADSFSVSAIGGRYLELLDDIVRTAGGPAT